MRFKADSLQLAPTDLSSFLGCRHRTGLDLSVATGLLEKPDWNNPLAQALRQRGEEHERAYVESLKSQGLSVVDLHDSPDGRDATLDALRQGVDVVVQAPLGTSEWQGYADILRRIEASSVLGSWAYEVYDTKLARETRGGTILQLAVYSELLAELQKKTPECFHVVTPPAIVQSYRFSEYAAYYRLVRNRLLDTLPAGPDSICETNYPEPVEQCEVCRWWEHCNQRRRRDDHLSFVAGLGRRHRNELEDQGAATLAAVAALPLPIQFTPARGSKDTYERFREQARLQEEQRSKGQPVYELLPVELGRGLASLPTPSHGDLFLDLEGARFAREGGREFLFGLWDGDYRSWWAYDDAAEARAFETVVDAIMESWLADPNMHIYHFGHYEPTTFKRLTGRHATRSEAVDQLLRSERFVDLHSVVRQALRAGVESYSIKQLEPFYGFTRDLPLDDAGFNLQAIQLALEGNASSTITDEVRESVATYNRDDCRSTQSLQGWLETLRAELVTAGQDLPRPEAKPGDASAKASALDQEVVALREELLKDLPPEACDPDHPQHPIWLLAYLIDWHRREDKAQWWDYFRVRELTAEDLLDEAKALVGLSLLDRVEIVTHSKTGKPTGSVVDRYGYPAQETDIGRRSRLKLRDGKAFGEVVACDRTARTVDLKKGPSRADDHPEVAFAGDVISSQGVQRAVMRLAEDISTTDCGLDLLFRHPPRLANGSFEPGAGESTTAFAVRAAGSLDHSLLAVQGPPGTGKTYTAAQMIRSLVRDGKRVGVTAISHKVIRNLLDEVNRQAKEAGEAVRLAHKVTEVAENGTEILEIPDNGASLSALSRGDVDVLGGTAWLWSREEAAETIDVLVIDEAGQMSLANALAVSQAATNLVLLGDPQQLEQPQKGTHPLGVDISALQHVLGSEKTMPPSRGGFLPITWRLAPNLCTYTSELFYEGRLEARPDLEHQRLSGTDVFDGAGLWFVPVEHDGNQNWSSEEVIIVSRIVDQLLSSTSNWVTSKGAQERLTGSDLRVVAPYNAQVNRLVDELEGRGVPVGTVDKFQGQEAPVVIYSMATSRPEDAPRGMEFLYNLNRLNVATSRAQCAVILVASPRLFEPECRTPRQMQLANALCRFGELAQLVSL